MYLWIQKKGFCGGGGCKVVVNLICFVNKIVFGFFLKYVDDYWLRQVNNRNIKKFFDFYFIESYWILVFFLYIFIENIQGIWFNFIQLDEKWFWKLIFLEIRKSQ